MAPSLRTLLNIATREISFRYVPSPSCPAARQAPYPPARPASPAGRSARSALVLRDAPHRNARDPSRHPLDLRENARHPVLKPEKPLVHSASVPRTVREGTEKLASLFAVSRRNIINALSKFFGAESHAGRVKSGGVFTPSDSENTVTRSRR